MAINTSAVQTFTDAELLILYRNALAAIATGQAVSIGGRQLTRANLADVRDMIEWLESRTNASTEGGNTALGVFGEPQ